MSAEQLHRATFGAGCFWGVEVAFRNTPGVTDAAVGYMGGHVENPTYEEVCTGSTGHAEVVQVTFDPAQTSYAGLLAVFFDTHDPTQYNRQDADVGAQYRSAIFTHDDEQRETAQREKEARRKDYERPIVTQIEPAGLFYPAEDYHQRYLEKRGLATCRI